MEQQREREAAASAQSAQGNEQMEGDADQPPQDHVNAEERIAARNARRHAARTARRREARRARRVERGGGEETASPPVLAERSAAKRRDRGQREARREEQRQRRWVELPARNESADHVRVREAGPLVVGISLSK